MKKRLGIIAGILGIVLAVIGIVLKQKENTAVSVIGGVWRKNRESVDISWGFWKKIKKVRVQRLSMMRIMITIRWK